MDDQEAQAAKRRPRPRVLISNDDGVNAPGLRALVTALSDAACCDIFVCGPSDWMVAGERSAQSHAITLKTHLEVWDIPVKGAVEAYAVSGAPADAVMLALNSDVFQVGQEFDLVVSGINRGNNAGLHVIYSGTVGAAREAACKGARALAVSVGDMAAKTEEAYSAAATLTVPLVKAMLGQLDVRDPINLHHLNAGFVLNVNFPRGGQADIKGYCLTRQGDICMEDTCVAVPDSEFQKAVQHDVGGGKMETRKVRQFKNKGNIRLTGATDRHGTDFWAMKNGWVSVCATGLQTDLRTSPEAAKRRNVITCLTQDLAQAAALSVDLPYQDYTGPLVDC